MISNQILQDTIDGLKSITRTESSQSSISLRVDASTLPSVSSTHRSVLVMLFNPSIVSWMSGLILKY